MAHASACCCRLQPTVRRTEVRRAQRAPPLKSSALLQRHLKEAGFSLEAGVADEPTAFIATYGHGSPIIGVLGEFDALPGLSQAAVPDRNPLAAAAPGHGCGHNLLGSGAALAAVALKEYMEKNNVAVAGDPGSTASIEPLRPFDPNQPAASTDVGDVSCNVPTIGYTAATFVPGVVALTWQAAACAGMSIGQKGMLVAAKALAVTGLDLFSNPQLIQDAKKDFARQIAGKTYKSEIPSGQKPPLNYRF